MDLGGDNNGLFRIYKFEKVIFKMNTMLTSSHCWAHHSGAESSTRKNLKWFLLIDPLKWKRKYYYLKIKMTPLLCAL